MFLFPRLEMGSRENSYRELRQLRPGFIEFPEGEIGRDGTKGNKRTTVNLVYSNTHAELEWSRIH